MPDHWGWWRKIVRLATVTNILLMVVVFFGLLVIGLLAVKGTTTKISSTSPLKQVRISLGYIPNVQFAPFYAAQNLGYFAENGLQVTLDHGMVTDILPLLGSGQTDFAITDSDQVILARSQGVPVESVMAIYPKTPTGIATLASSNIKTTADLRGKKIGIPGMYGASYVALLAYLDLNGMKVSDVNLQAIGYTQVQALTQKSVDAVVVFMNNEVLQLEDQGVAINTIAFGDQLGYVGQSLVVSEQAIKDYPQDVAAVIRAIKAGMDYVRANPDQGMTISQKFITDLSASQLPLQKKVLQATIVRWSEPGQVLGFMDPSLWQTTYAALKTQSLLGKQLDVTQVYTNQFVNP